MAYIDAVERAAPSFKSLAKRQTTSQRHVLLILRKPARLPDDGAGQDCHDEIQTDVEDEAALDAEFVGYGRHEEWERKRAYSATGGYETYGEGQRQCAYTGKDKYEFSLALSAIAG